MNKYLNELESDLSELETRIHYAQSSYDDVEKEFEEMEKKLDDISDVIVEDELTVEEKITEIKAILAR